MKRFCVNCGKKLDTEKEYCEECSKIIEEQSKNNSLLSTILSIFSIILFVSCRFFEAYYFVPFLLSVVFIVLARVLCPKNLVGIIMMWIEIGLFIMYMCLLFLFLRACGSIRL